MSVNVFFPHSHLFTSLCSLCVQTGIPHTHARALRFSTEGALSPFPPPSNRPTPYLHPNPRLQLLNPKPDLARPVQEL